MKLLNHLSRYVSEGIYYLRERRLWVPPSHCFGSLVDKKRQRKGESVLVQGCCSVFPAAHVGDGLLPPLQHDGLKLHSAYSHSHYLLEARFT